MKNSFLLLLLILLAQTGFAQTRLWIMGSAVPGGTQELERFPMQGSSAYCFKFHGKLLPGDLYITTTEEEKSSTYYYGPKLVDSNIVNEGIAWKKTRTKDGSQWAVLFEADNYRFTINPATGGDVKGELFAWWYEALVVGGCVADRQGESKGNTSWQLESGVQMERTLDNPYEWRFHGTLKNYTYNEQPKRFKIIGQYGWGPKSLQSLKQDASILTATQVSYGGDDLKWSIENDGFYVISANVFTETIRGEYYKDEHEWTALENLTADQSIASVTINDRIVTLTSDRMVTARMYAVSGTLADMQSGTQVRMTAPAAGTYVLLVESPEGTQSQKVVIR